MKPAFTPFDAAQYLDNDAVIAEYLTAATEDADPSAFLAALGDVAKAHGMAQIARESGLGRESLYKSLEAGAHPRYETISAVLKALGVKFEVVANSSETADSPPKRHLSEEAKSFTAQPNAEAWERLTSEHLDRLYKPIGEIMVQWALIDMSLHYLGFSMFKAIGTTPLKEKWQIAFGPRLDVVEKLFVTRTDFADLAPAAKSMIKSLRHLQDLRNMLVHGAAVRFDKAKDAVIWQRIDQATKQQRRKDPEISHLQSTMLVRFSMLAEAAEHCVEVNVDLLNLREKVKTLAKEH